MSTEEIIEESKKRLSNGSDLLDISKFLNDLNIES